MHYHQLFNRKSTHYAEARPHYPDPLFGYLGEICRVRKLAWDGACGNGQAAIGLVDYFDHIQASDISENQIANAVHHPKITYSVQPSERTMFKDDQFDLVCIAQALHWFDYDQFWPEVKRVLKPSGVFAAWGYSWFSIDKKIDAVIQEKFLKFLVPYWEPQNKLLWDHYRDVPFPFKIIEPPQIEMKISWDLDQLFDYLRSWSSTTRCLEEIGEPFFLDAYFAASDVWRDPQKRLNLKMDFCLLVGKNES